MTRYLLAGCLGLTLVGCGSPPANWPKGGAALDIPRARWANGPSTIDILPDGQVLVNGNPAYTLDRAGRLADLDDDAVALLEADGHVTGEDDEPMGQVGWTNAARAGESTAWISLQPTGQVVRFNDDGEAEPFGIWFGCAVSPRASQACTFVTHVLAERIRSQPEDAPVSFGIGIGVGIPIR